MGHLVVPGRLLSEAPPACRACTFWAGPTLSCPNRVGVVAKPEIGAVDAPP